MEVNAKARYIRMSPRKVRLVADLIRGMDLGQAVNQLRFFRKAAARPVLKVVLSAAANAEHNFKMDADTLFVKSIMVDGGPVLQRWRARAFGRAAPLKKRSAHITVVLADREAKAGKGVSAAVVKPAEEKKAPEKPAAKAEKKARSAKPEAKSSK